MKALWFIFEEEFSVIMTGTKKTQRKIEVPLSTYNKTKQTFCGSNCLVQNVQISTETLHL